MALVWVDGFEGYCDTTANDVAPSPAGVLEDKYLYAHDASRFRLRNNDAMNGHMMRVSNGVYNSIIKTHDVVSDGTCIVGMGIQIYDYDKFTPDFRWPIVSMETSSNVICFALMFQADGSCYFQDGSGDHIGGTRQTMQRGGWNYLEVKSESGNTANAEVRLNGATVWSGTINTAGGTIERVGIGRNINSYGFKFGRIDNYYVCDGSGNTNNDFLGVVDIETLWPDGDDSVNWSTTGNANYATHYQQLIRGDRDGTTDYVEESTANTWDLFTLDDLSSNMDTIYGAAVISLVNYSTTNAGFQNVLSSNGTTTNGPSLPITTAMEVWADDDGLFIVEEDPDTGNAWTNAGINAMKTGFRTAP